ncbi:hypothetical protein SCALM49S_01840 [Streptomyces californicus]
MTANTHQHGAALTSDGTLLVVGTGPIGPDDEDPSLMVRAPDGTERIVPLDGPHEDVAVSKDGRTAYVTGGFTRDGHWNGITVVDLDDEKSEPVRLAAGQLDLRARPPSSAKRSRPLVPRGGRLHPPPRRPTPPEASNSPRGGQLHPGVGGSTSGEPDAPKIDR